MTSSRFLLAKWKQITLAIFISSFLLLLCSPWVFTLIGSSTNYRRFNTHAVDMLKKTPYTEYKNGSAELSALLNSSCYDNYTVPNIVHYVWLSKTKLDFHEYVSILSASKFIQPCYILLHGDTIPGGKWWDMVQTQVHNIIHVRRKPPKEIFGVRLKYIEHKSDVMRLQILMEYGGIYTDVDMYFLRSLNPLRNSSLTLSRVDNSAVANGLIIANKDSAFLKIWYLTYHAYNRDSWAENSVHMALKLVNALPKLVHVEKGMILLGNKFQSVYKENINWDSTRYSVHLYSRLFDKRTFELDEIKTLNTTFGALSRYIIFGTKNIILD